MAQAGRKLGTDPDDTLAALVFASRHGPVVVPLGADPPEAPRDVVSEPMSYDTLRATSAPRTPGGSPEERFAALDRQPVWDRAELQSLARLADAAVAWEDCPWPRRAHACAAYFDALMRHDECLARITPLAGDVLLLEVEGRTAWREVSRSNSPGVLVACMATDPDGTFHGLAALHDTLGDVGSGRREMVCADDGRPVWHFLDEPPSRGQASVPEVLGHAFGVPVPVLASPRSSTHSSAHRPSSATTRTESWSSSPALTGAR